MAKQVYISTRNNFFQEMTLRAAQTSGEVIMVILRLGDKLLLNSKTFYPNEVYRLPSGKIGLDETPSKAFLREAYEETGLKVEIDRTLETIEWKILFESKHVNYTSNIIMARMTCGEPSPLDADERISGYREIEPCRLLEIARQLESLAEPWHDWGMFRSIPHILVYERLCP